MLFMSKYTRYVRITIGNTSATNRCDERVVQGRIV